MEPIYAIFALCGVAALAQVSSSVQRYGGFNGYWQSWKMSAADIAVRTGLVQAPSNAEKPVSRKLLKEFQNL